MKYAISLIFLLLCNVVWAKAIDWNNNKIEWNNYEEGISKAKAEQKPVMMVQYAEWCGYSKQFGKHFFKPEVIENSKNFIMVKVDVDQEPEIAELYDVQAVPMTFFLDKNAEPIQAEGELEGNTNGGIGVEDAEQLVHFMNIAEHTEK